MKTYTGCRFIDSVIKPGDMVLFYGEAGAGKTRILLNVARMLSEAGSRVLFIGTEDTLYYEIVGRRPHDYSGVFFIDVRDIYGLVDVLLRINTETQPIHIVVDSINAPYRLVAYTETALSWLGLALSLLKNHALRHGAAVFSSAQVRGGYRSDEDEVQASGMPVLAFWYSVIIRVGRDEHGRFAELVKPPGKGDNKARFLITGEGVEWIDGCG